MEVGLTNNEEILMNLLSIIPILPICKGIIDLKDKIERKDTLNYHVERWVTISSFKIKMFANKKKYDNFVSNFNSCIRGLKYECLAEEHLLLLRNGEPTIFGENQCVSDVLDDEQYDIMNICNCSEIVGNLREFEDEWCS